MNLLKKASLAAAVSVAAVAPVVLAPSAEAHSCTYVCNTVENMYWDLNKSTSIGIYDYLGNSSWSWLEDVGGNRSDGPPVNQPDVDAVYIGSFWCAKRFSGVDNSHFTELPFVTGPTKVGVTEYQFNRIYAYEMKYINGAWTCNF